MNLPAIKAWFSHARKVLPWDIGLPIPHDLKQYPVPGECMTEPVVDDLREIVALVKKEEGLTTDYADVIATPSHTEACPRGGLPCFFLFPSTARPVATVKVASLQNVLTCCQLHTLCNNGFVAKNHQQAVLKHARKLGVLRPRDLNPIGVPRVYLKQLVESGELLKTGRGLYVVAGAPLTENHSLAEAAKLSPKGVMRQFLKRSFASTLSLFSVAASARFRTRRKTTAA